MQKQHERSGEIFERVLKRKGRGKKKQLNAKIEGYDA